MGEDIFRTVQDTNDMLRYATRRQWITILLVVIQVVVGLIIAARVIRVLLRVERLLKLTERHGDVTNHQLKRTEQIEQKMKALVDQVSESPVVLHGPRQSLPPPT